MRTSTNASSSRRTSGVAGSLRPEMAVCLSTVPYNALSLASPIMPHLISAANCAAKNGRARATVSPGRPGAPAALAASGWPQQRPQWEARGSRAPARLLEAPRSQSRAKAVTLTSVAGAFLACLSRHLDGWRRCCRPLLWSRLPPRPTCRHRLQPLLPAQRCRPARRPRLAQRRPPPQTAQHPARRR